MTGTIDSVSDVESSEHPRRAELEIDVLHKAGKSAGQEGNWERQSGAAIAVMY